jgi:hypothetical protein
MDICASISSISILEDAFFHRSCAYNVQRLLLILILSYSILPFSGFRLSCVRAPYWTSEPRAASSVRSPLVYMLALTLIKIARVVLPVLICQIFLISIVCCCIRRCMSSPLTKFLLLASPEPTDLGLFHRYQAPRLERHV